MTPNAAKQQRFRERNRDALRVSEQARYAGSPRRFETHLQRQYGITLHDYEALLAKQKYVCAICEIKPEYRLHVDHDHQSGVVRGLLCAECNRMLGQARDCTKILRRAAKYLADALI